MKAAEVSCGAPAARSPARRAGRHQDCAARPRSARLQCSLAGGVSGTGFKKERTPQAREPCLTAGTPTKLRLDQGARGERSRASRAGRRPALERACRPWSGAPGEGCCEPCRAVRCPHQEAQPQKSSGKMLTSLTALQ